MVHKYLKRSFSDWEGGEGHGLTRKVCVDTMQGGCGKGVSRGGSGKGSACTEAGAVGV